MASTAVRALATIPLFAGVPEGTLAALEAELRTLRIDAGTELFAQGDQADDLFVVVRGRLRVTRNDEHGVRDVNELGPGAAVGELALLTGSPRTATVRAVRDTTLLVLPGETFAAHAEREPALALAIARDLARQIQRSGGLPLAEARPTLLAVSGLSPGAPVREFAASLAAALEPFGHVAVLDRGDAETIESAEGDNERVLLVDTGEDHAWSALCRRQADRQLVVALGGERTEALPAATDLVVLGPYSGANLRGLLDAAEPRAFYRLATTEPSDPGIGRLARRLVGRSLGIALSGGGARGFAHIGVLEELEEAGIVIDRYAGCSMGAFIAAMAAAGWRPTDIRDRCHEELVRRSPFNDYTVPRFSLIRSRKAERMFHRLFHDLTIEELPKPLVTVSADLLSSTVVEHRRGSLLEAVGASMSIPGLAPPLPRGGRLLVDGGVLNNLPVDALTAAGEGPVIAVDVIRSMARADDDASLPNIMETLSRATVLGSTERAERNRDLALLVIAPDAQSVQLREFRALDRAIEAGRLAARETLAAGGLEMIERALAVPTQE